MVRIVSHISSVVHNSIERVTKLFAPVTSDVKDAYGFVGLQ